MSNEKEALLTDREKVISMRSIFESSSLENTKYVKNVGDFIASNFDKVEGFDWRWSSLITNNPLLFEDTDYLRVKPFINATITDAEKDAYVRGDLRELYATFENMLMCNLRQYDRIMAYCTMVFLHYVRVEEALVNKGLDKVVWELEMTPTRIWCAAMSGPQSTPFELGYGWGSGVVGRMTKPKNGMSLLQSAWPILYKLPAFAKFMEYSALRCGTFGFRATWVSDTTSNRKLAQACAKFTKTSVAISEQQLDTLHAWWKETEAMKNRLYEALDKCLVQMFNGDRGQYSIYVFPREFYIYTSKFTIRVHSTNGVIGKDYLANSHECFIAEEHLVPSIRAQIDWARWKVPSQYEYDRNVLKSLLTTMLDTTYRDIVCIRRMNDYGTLTRVSFKGHFANVRIVEDFMTDNRVIRTVEKVLGKANAARYLIERGYCVFGVEKDIWAIEDIGRASLVKHYSNYCVPVITHMFDVIAAHEISKNDIIDVVVSGTLNPNKLNNEEGMRFTNLMTNDPKLIMSTGLERQNRLTLGKRKSYWKAIED
jgi:hypothetical protein